MRRFARYVLALWLFHPIAAAAGGPTSGETAPPGECAEPANTPIHSGNAEPTPQGQDEALRALGETAAERRAREAERSPARSDSQAAPSESDPARR